MRQQKFASGVEDLSNANGKGFELISFRHSDKRHAFRLILSVNWELEHLADLKSRHVLVRLCSKWGASNMKRHGSKSNRIECTRRSSAINILYHALYVSAVALNLPSAGMLVQRNSVATSKIKQINQRDKIQFLS